MPVNAIEQRVFTLSTIFVATQSHSSFFPLQIEQTISLKTEGAFAASLTIIAFEL